MSHKYGIFRTQFRILFDESYVGTKVGHNIQIVGIFEIRLEENKNYLLENIF